MEGLARDIVNANIHFRMYQNLNNSISDYCSELNQSPTFWNLAMSAQIDAALLRLCRAYDSHSSSLSLPRLLVTINQNSDIFETPNFKERLKDNPFVESLASDDRVPDKNALAADIKLASETDYLVSRLHKWRNNIGAHRNPKETITPNSMAGDPLEFAEIEELLARAIHILNRYSSLFKALSYSSNMIGSDDYIYVLGCVRRDIETRKQKLAEEMAKYESGSP